MGSFVVILCGQVLCHEYISSDRDHLKKFSYSNLLVMVKNALLL